MRSIYLVDCPGVVYDEGDEEYVMIMKGVVRSEKLDSPKDYISDILSHAMPHHLSRTYEISNWTDANDLMSQIAKKTGRLLKGGEPDLDAIARIIINDWQRGSIPWFLPPPDVTEVVEEENLEKAAEEEKNKGGYTEKLNPSYRVQQNDTNEKKPNDSVIIVNQDLNALERILEAEKSGNQIVEGLEDIEEIIEEIDGAKATEQTQNDTKEINAKRICRTKEIWQTQKKAI